MQTQIRFIDGKAEDFGDDATVKMTAQGVEVLVREGDDVVRVTFPWTRIEKVTQRGTEVTAVYTF